MQSVQMKERLSNVLAWFVVGCLSVIALTDLLWWALWNIAGIPLHLFMREDTLLRVLSLGFEIVGNNTLKEFFPLIFSAWIICSLINYVLVGSARLLPWKKYKDSDED